MNVVAVNGSARMEKGYTAKVLSPFVEGMREAGAHVDLYYAKQLNIAPCTGEFYCWEEKPGECYQQDGMQAVYPKLRGADVLLLASPVYIPLPGEMQNFLNRLCPLINPALSWRDGRTRARLRGDVKVRKIVLVAVGGWWELGNLDTVVRIVEELAKDCDVEFASPILRPHAYYLGRSGEKAHEVLEALRKAGVEFVKEGAVSKNLLEVISQPLVSKEEYK
jgi:multimeric flavodoxin WrbA